MMTIEEEPGEFAKFISVGESPFLSVSTFDSYYIDLRQHSRMCRDDGDGETGGNARAMIKIMFILIY